MSHLPQKFTFNAEPEALFKSIARAYSADADFAVMCHVLRSRPKFGYGPVRVETDAEGKVSGFAYGVQPLDFDCED